MAAAATVFNCSRHCQDSAILVAQETAAHGHRPNTQTQGPLGTCRPAVPGQGPPVTISRHQIIFDSKCHDKLLCSISSFPKLRCDFQGKYSPTGRNDLTIRFPYPYDYATTSRQSLVLRQSAPVFPMCQRRQSDGTQSRQLHDLYLLNSATCSSLDPERPEKQGKGPDASLRWLKPRRNRSGTRAMEGPRTFASG